MTFDEWPDCPVRGCQFKICLALNSDKCFHHTPGNKHVKRWKINALNGVPEPEVVARQRAYAARKD
jgi:hypothetical protein